VEPADDEDDDYEPGTVASLPAQVLASLIVRGIDGHLREVYPIGPRTTLIGRGKRAGNDIVLASDGMVSKRHTAVVYDEGTGRFLVRDEGSTNGTFLNGVRLSPGQARPLEPGDQILLGETTLIFRPTEEPSVDRPRPAPPRTSSAGSFRAPVAVEQPLMLVSADGETHLLASEMTVGRSFTSDLVLVGAGVASQHARLFRKSAPNSGGEERFYVEDLGTPGGTFVNRERIPARFPVALYENDEVAFGDVSLRFVRRTAETDGIR
jgi:pSer/pThr/pTyr-binding forkhead associated (FHA) protein